MDIVKLRKPYKMSELIELATKDFWEINTSTKERQGLCPDIFYNMDVYTFPYKDDFSITADLICFIEEPTYVTDEDEEIFSDFVIENNLEFLYSGENFVSVIQVAFSQKRYPSMEEFLDSLNFYREHDAFLLWDYDKVLTVEDDGICIFSVEAVQNFLKKRRIGSTKTLLKLFQNDKELFLDSQKEGVWIPFLSVNGIDYLIKLDGYDEPFNDEWEQMLAYDGFNIEIKNSIWISSISSWTSFNSDEFAGDEIVRHTIDGADCFIGFKYVVPSGKYLLSVKGYVRREKQNCSVPHYGYLFSLKRVRAFDGYKNPLKDGQYEFNMG